MEFTASFLKFNQVYPDLCLSLFPQSSPTKSFSTDSLRLTCAFIRMNEEEHRAVIGFEFIKFLFQEIIRL